MKVGGGLAKPLTCIASQGLAIATVKSRAGRLHAMARWPRGAIEKTLSVLRGRGLRTVIGSLLSNRNIMWVAFSNACR